MKKTDNGGFSLVEVVITIAIMAILTSMVAYGLSLSSGKKAEECASKLASELQTMRTMAFGKYEVTGELYYDSSSDSYILTRVVKTSKDEGTSTDIVVGAGVVDVSYSNYPDDDTYKSLKAEGSIYFKFSRSTGALNLYEPNTYCYIKVEKSKKIKYVDIVPLTGRVLVTDNAPTEPITMPDSTETEKTESE